MTLTQRCHPYVFRIVTAPPGAAGPGLDFVRRCLLGHGPDREAPFEIATPEGVLRLDGPLTRTGSRGYVPLRSIRGTLRPAGGRRRPAAGVTLELLPWSSRWSELALVSDPLPWGAAGGRTERAYLQAAHGVLGRLGRMIEAPADAWLARLVAGRPLILPLPERSGL